MSVSVPDVSRLASLSDDELFAELGRSIVSAELEMLPDESEELEDDARGRRFFSDRLVILKSMICNQKMTEYVRDEKKRDVINFVAAFIDIVSGYFGIVIGTILLVQIYKIGIDQFCDMTDISS